MSEILPFQPIKCFVGVLFKDHEQLSDIKRELGQHYGPIDSQSDTFSYSHTSFYEEEMGADLQKTFFTFERLLNPEHLYKVKIITNAIEDKSKTNSKRSINLDPGALSLHNLILLSAKNYFHRIPLQQGIYAELTLSFSKKRFQEFPWTYPDFKRSSYHDYFKSVRSLYHNQLTSMTQ